MRSVALGFICLVAVALMAADYDHGTHQPRYSYVGSDCVTKGSGTLLALGGATLGTVTNVNFAAGSACTVIPPVGVPVSIALRCAVGAGSADIIATVPVAATAPAGEWCVEVRTVAPAFQE